LEKKAPKLIAEMREDLRKHPLVREFAVVRKALSYNPGPTPCFVYYPDDHDYLLSLMTIMRHAGAIYDITSTEVPR
jgi:hypothetical protein